MKLKQKNYNDSARMEFYGRSVKKLTTELDEKFLMELRETISVKWFFFSVRENKIYIRTDVNFFFILHAS